MLLSIMATIWTSILLITVIVSARAASINDQLLAETDELINSINRAQTTWKAGRNFPLETKLTDVSRLLGLKKSKGKRLLPLKKPIEEDKEIGKINLPSAFDAREKWLKCKSLQQVKDQGSCGSCWAVSTTAAFTDRLCIASEGEFNGYLSSEEILSCCKSCGNGCYGGDDEQAWKYMMYHGIVTGGDYNSNEGCKSYSIQPCGGKREDCKHSSDTPKCYNYCTNRNYSIPYPLDGHRARSAYRLPNDTDTIKLEVMTNGPVASEMEVYQDFSSYKTGVYEHVDGSVYLGNHSVKMIGWGEENGVPYWSVANSWGKNWGDEGFFKIALGTNECGIENGVLAGMP